MRSLTLNAAVVIMLLVVGVMHSPAMVRAAEPEKMDLFAAGENGYETCRIPGIVVTKKGTVLVYCEARKSARGDWGQIDVLLRRSTDGGKTFDAARKIVEAPNVERNPAAAKQGLGKQGGVTVNNPTAIADLQGGAVHFLYCVEYARCFYMRSDDDGVSFSRPVEITSAFEPMKSKYKWVVLATGPGHGVRLTGGRLIVPVWLSTGEGGHAHRPSCVSTIYSDDDGKTWAIGEIVANTTKEAPNPSETIAVELADGRVMLNIRNESPRHRRLVSVSKDGAGSWSRPEFDEALLEPICMASIARVSPSPFAGGSRDAGAKRGRIVYASPVSEESQYAAKNAGKNKSRKNLTVRLSDDEGRTWPAQRLLQDGIAAYSDLAVLGDGTILCFYECGGVNEQHYYTKSLRLARFTAEWVEGK